MSDQVISLTSSDEEDNAEPPSKKRKITPNLPECTVTLVTTNPVESASKTIETVSLDSDDEIAEGKNNPVKKSTSSVGSVEKTVNLTNNIDLISLTDDEENIVQPKVKKLNGTNNSVFDSKAAKCKSLEIGQETVSIDDSDTEVEAKNEKEGSVDNREAGVERDKKEKNNHSIIIDDSDDETEKENHCEKDHIQTFPVHIEKTSAADVASTSKLGKKQLDDIKTNVSNSQKDGSRIVEKYVNGNQDELEEAKGLFKRFIKMIEEKVVDSSYEEILPKKVPIIKKYFNRSGAYVNDKVVKALLNDSIEGIRKSSTATGANCAVLAFHKVFDHLKSHVAETTIVVEEDNLPKIKKLEHTIKLLRKRIHQLEVAEVNFDDDEDSSYIMLDRYQCRLNKVYAKYCQYINRNPYSGRATYDRITFVNSSYNEINHALTRKYKNSLVFPSYFELENYVIKVSKKEKLNLSDGEIKIESKKCFKVLGSILQKKRRQELYDSHLDFVESSEDPASKDISLENVLKKNFAAGKEKIEKLYQKFVNKQERGEDHVSTDEEQSSDESSDKDKKGKVKKIGKVQIKKKSNETDKDSKKGKGENKEKTEEYVEDKHDMKAKKIENHKDKSINQEQEPKNKEDIHKEKENTCESKQEMLADKPKNKQDNQEDNVKNKKDKMDVEKDKIETQEEFLSALDMQKQKE